MQGEEWHTALVSCPVDQRIGTQRRPTYEPVRIVAVGHTRFLVEACMATEALLSTQQKEEYDATQYTSHQLGVWHKYCLA
jgi:hypothetical protein